jgi:large subunit ribosomal protein L7Ae
LLSFSLPCIPSATQLFRLLHKYRPETRAEKKERLRSLAQKKTEGGDTASKKKPITLKYGINHVTNLIEQKKATLVVIAHDVDPIEVCYSTYTHTHTHPLD